MNKRKTTNTNTISYAGRNPHLDNLKAKGEAEKAVIILTDRFDKVEKVGRKQLYKINDSFSEVEDYWYNPESGIVYDLDLDFPMGKIYSDNGIATKLNKDTYIIDQLIDIPNVNIL